MNLGVALAEREGVSPKASFVVSLRFASHVTPSRHLAANPQHPASMREPKARLSVRFLSCEVDRTTDHHDAQGLDCFKRFSVLFK